MKIAIILGTRPEIIKMSPIIRFCNNDDRFEYFILHTGQHYDYEMDKTFFNDLELRRPDYNLNVGGKPYRKQVGLMIRSIINILKKENPDLVLVQGDTNSVLAGALAANKLGIKLGHHEAGLRSHDLTMLEETNRIITDHISDYLFSPTQDAFNNLFEEGLLKNKIFMTGNTIVDAVKQNLELSRKKVNVLKKFKVTKKKYILVTAHRAENVDDEGKLKDLMKGLDLVAKKFDFPLIYPIHPRTLNNFNKFKISISPNIKLLKPLGYLEFLQLEANACLVITDSGGLQEESCILRVPCVTVRDNTERPETIKAGVNILAGTKPKKILKAVEKMLNLKKNKEWINPFGDGKSAKNILNILYKENIK